MSYAYLIKYGHVRSLCTLFHSEVEASESSSVGGHFSSTPLKCNASVSLRHVRCFAHNAVTWWRSVSGPLSDSQLSRGQAATLPPGKPDGGQSETELRKDPGEGKTRSILPNRSGWMKIEDDELLLFFFFLKDSGNIVLAVSGLIDRKGYCFFPVFSPSPQLRRYCTSGSRTS